MYNIPLSYLDGIPLNLTRDALCGIFTGNITEWSHPAILGNNTAINATDLVGKNITVRTIACSIVTKEAYSKGYRPR